MRKVGVHPFQLWLAGTVLAVGLAVLAIVPDIVQKERFGQLSEMTSKNAVLGRLWLTSQIGEWKATLKAARRSHMAAGTDGVASVDFKNFTGVVALIQSGVDPWQVAWTEKTSEFEYENLLSDPSFLQEVTAGFRGEAEATTDANGATAATGPTVSNKTFLHWIPAGSKSVAVAFMEAPLVSADGTKRTQVALVGFLPTGALDQATRFFRGGVADLSILSRTGVFFASPDRSQLGEQIPTSTLSDRILRGKTPAFEGIVKDDSKEEFQVATEAVPDSNVIVLARTPVSAVLKAARTTKMMLVAFFGALIFFVLLIGRAFIEGVRRKINQLIEMASTPMEDRANKLRGRFQKDADWLPLTSLLEQRGSSSQSTTLAAKENTNAAAVTGAEHVAEAPISAKAELESLEQAGFYISQCLKEPIAASIGHLKLAKSKTAEPEASKHLGHVETEIRRIKDLTEKVQKLGVYKALQTKPDDVSSLMRDLIEDVSVMAETVGVKVRQSLYPVPKARVAANDFRDAMKTLIQERVFSSQAQGKSEIVIGVEPSGSQVVIRIEDRCIPLTEGERDDFFRPLAQSSKYDHLHQKMLAILNYHDLKIRFDSEVQDGNLLLLELPVMEESIADHSAFANASVPTVAFSSENLTLEGDENNPGSGSSSRSDTDLWELSKSQTQKGASGLALDFLEIRSENEMAMKDESSGGLQEDQKSSQVRGAESTEDRSDGDVVSGPLSQYSVKVRKPRLNVPLEN